MPGAGLAHVAATDEPNRIKCKEFQGALKKRQATPRITFACGRAHRARAHNTENRDGDEKFLRSPLREREMQQHSTANKGSKVPQTTCVSNTLEEAKITEKGISHYGSSEADGFLQRAIFPRGQSLNRAIAPSFPTVWDFLRALRVLGTPYEYSLRPPHVSAIAWASVTPAIRQQHIRCLRKLQMTPAELLRQSIVSTVIECVPREALPAGWKPPTIDKEPWQERYGTYPCTRWSDGVTSSDKIRSG